MKTINKSILILIVFTYFCLGCGQFEKYYDDGNYESLTNEVGDIHFYSGGKEIVTYRNAKILYSSSDTQAMWIICNGKDYYLQGDCIIDLKK